MDTQNKIKEKSSENLEFSEFFHTSDARFGGDKRDRTADLLNAMGSIVNINEYFWSEQSNMSYYIA